MNFLKLATNAAQTALKHADNVHKTLDAIQAQADKHLQGTELHKKITKNVNQARGAVSLATKNVDSARSFVTSVAGVLAKPAIAVPSVAHGGAKDRKGKSQKKRGRKRKVTRKTTGNPQQRRRRTTSKR